MLADTEKETPEMRKNIEDLLKEANATVEIVAEILDYNLSKPPKRMRHDIQQARQQWIPILFDGTPSKWPTFWASWSEVVDQDDSLTHLAKAKMLADCLTGKAKEVIGEMNITAENLENMKAALKNEYNDPNNLLDTYTAEL